MSIDWKKSQKKKGKRNAGKGATRILAANDLCFIALFCNLLVI